MTNLAAITITGPRGCDKTHLLDKITELLQKDPLWRETIVNKATGKVTVEVNGTAWELKEKEE